MYGCLKESSWSSIPVFLKVTQEKSEVKALLLSLLFITIGSRVKNGIRKTLRVWTQGGGGGGGLPYKNVRGASRTF